jgi:hypothetical protein
VCVSVCLRFSTDAETPSLPVSESVCVSLSVSVQEKSLSDDHSEFNADAKALSLTCVSVCISLFLCVCACASLLFCCFFFVLFLSLILARTKTAAGTFVKRDNLCSRCRQHISAPVARDGHLGSWVKAAALITAFKYVMENCCLAVHVSPLLRVLRSCLPHTHTHTHTHVCGSRCIFSVKSTSQQLPHRRTPNQSQQKQQQQQQQQQQQHQQQEHTTRQAWQGWRPKSSARRKSRTNPGRRVETHL